VKATNKLIALVPPLRDQTQDHSKLWACSDEEKAEFFAAHLSKVFTPNENHTDQEIEKDISTLPQNLLPTKLLSPKEIKEEIGFLNMKEAPGIDKVTTTMMKELSKKGLVMLKYIFNAMLRLSY
jgi:hypothetical protein